MDSAGETPVVMGSGGLATWLAACGASLALTTYQANRLFLIGCKPGGGMRAHERRIDHCQGLWSDGQTLWASSDSILWRFENDLPAGVFNSITFSAGGYTLGGNTITLGRPVTGSGFITVGSGAAGNTISLGMSLGSPNAADQTFTVNAGGTLTISGSHLVMKRGKVTVYPRTVRLTIGEPIPVSGLAESDAAALSERVRGVVQQTLATGP